MGTKSYCTYVLETLMSKISCDEIAPLYTILLWYHIYHDNIVLETY